MKKLLYGAEALAFLLLLALSAVFRAQVSRGIYRAISYSVGVLIPSLLPFLFFSGLFSLSPACRLLCRLFAPAGRAIFRLSPSALPAVLFGLSCGYPVGARLTAELLENGEIGENEAARLLIFTMNPGAPFCVLFLGSTVLKSAFSGLLIYLAVTAACICAGILLGLLSGSFHPAETPERDLPGLPAAIKRAADSTVSACLSMSFYIVLFWGFLAILRESGAFAAAVRSFPFPGSREKAGLLSFFFEVTGGISDSVLLGLPLSVYVLGLSFGGLCVHMQLFSFFRKPPLRYGRFLLWRIIQCALSLAFFLPLLPLLPAGKARAVSSLVYEPVFGGLKGNFLGSFCLILLFITYCLVSQERNGGKAEKNMIK